MENLELKLKNLNKELISFFKGKKVFITGHTGFKGAWLTIWLLNMEAEIAGYALPPKNDNDIFKLANLENKIFNFFGDIRDFSNLEKTMNDFSPDIVFHLAAQPLVIESYKYPQKTFETNIMGTVNLLEAIRKNKSVKEIVIITSDKCYENFEWVWGYRENDPLGGKDPYSASKASVEIVAQSYLNSFFQPMRFNEHNKVLVTVRAGNVIGGGDWSAYRIVPDCIRALENNTAIKLRNPNAIRPWQHVLEPLGGYLLLASKMHENPALYSGGWNFGPQYDSFITVEELTRYIIKYWGKGNYIIDNNPKFNEAQYLALDINKSFRLLKWSPKLSISESIKLTIDWYKNYKSKDVYELCSEQIDFYLEK